MKPEPDIKETAGKLNRAAKGSASTQTENCYQGGGGGV